MVKSPPEVVWQIIFVGVDGALLFYFRLHARSPRTQGVMKQEGLHYTGFECWLQPFPGQVFKAGELCWTNNRPSAYGTLESLDRTELEQKLWYLFPN